MITPQHDDGDKGELQIPVFIRYRALRCVEDRMVKVGCIFHTAQNYARLV